jgi:hypothetical protein
MANRFDNAYVSAYNPLSMDELAMAPMMKRKQHDDTLAKQELVKSGLAKTDPHSKYFERAQQLKSELETEMDTTAQQLATQGVNNDMVGKTIALNRKFQDLTSPTGELGQINAHNQNFKTTSAEYLNNATKLGYSPQIVQKRLEEFQQKHVTEEDRDELGNIKMFKPDLPTNYYDHIKVASDLFKDAGLTQSQTDNLGSHIAYDNVGQSYVLTTGYKTGNANNDAQLEAAVKSLNDRLLDQKQPVRQALDYQGISPEQALEDIKLLSPVYSKKSTDTGSTSQISNYNPGSGADKTEVPDTESIVTSTAEVGTDLNDYNTLDEIGQLKPVTLIPIEPDETPANRKLLTEYNDKLRFRGARDPKLGGSYKYTVDDIDDDVIKSRVKSTYNDLVERGALPKNADINSGAAIKLIKAELIKQGPITLSTKTIKPNQALSTYLFPNKLVGKDDSATAANINNDIINNARTVIDIETGQVIPVSEFKENGAKVTSYYGYDSPHNWGQNGKDFNFGNKSQRVAPHRIVIEQDGKVITAVMSRSSNEFNTREFSVMSDLHDTYRQVTLAPNRFVKFESSKPALKNLKVKYTTKDKAGYALMEPEFTVKLPNGSEKTFNESQYIKFVVSLGLKTK